MGRAEPVNRMTWPQGGQAGAIAPGFLTAEAWGPAVPEQKGFTGESSRRILPPHRRISGPVRLSSPLRHLRTHQRQIHGLMAAIAAGQASGITDVLAAVTPGGGKSLLPVIAAARLMRAGVVERVCWVVPRDSLRLQAEEAFADPRWRAALGHDLSVRAAENEPDPSRGLAGYVTTYQAIAAAPDLHRVEIRRRRTLLVVDEVHHLPALADAETPADLKPEDASAWSRALLPLLDGAALRLHLSGTLERADGRPSLWLPYRPGGEAGTREVDLEAPGWAVVGYSRAQAVAERAVLPVTFEALDGEASWLEGGRTAAEPPRVGRTDSPDPIRSRPPARPCSRRCARASRASCSPKPSGPRGPCARDAGPSGAWGRLTPRGAWASSWWSRPIRPPPGATATCCAAGCPKPKPSARCVSPPRTRATRRRPWRPSASSPSRRSW